MSESNIRIGTSGYSFQEWKGNAYPASIKDSEMFDYYLQNFGCNTVEINYTYFRQPTARVFETLVKKSPDGFDFTIKLFGGITHEPFKDYMPNQIDVDMCSKFLEGIRPVIEAGKLGCLLAQFPASLLRCPEAWGYILSLPDVLDNLPLVFEFRNKGWASEETLHMLKHFGIGFCVVDEPQLGALMPLVPAVTSDIAYLRLHGRSPKWFKDPKHRYDYLYSDKELREFLPIIKRLASQGKTLYIAMNNCHAGAAVQNVKMLQDLLGLDYSPTQGRLF